MSTPNAPRTARERARAELTREIKEEARRQLASVGANGLSLRAVARELGMVSSALYRYYPSRDDLLTAPDHRRLQRARRGRGAGHRDHGRARPRARWLAACHAIRDWARSQPARVRADLRLARCPATAPPRRRSRPAGRVPLAFVGVLGSARGGRRGRRASPARTRPRHAEVGGALRRPGGRAARRAARTPPAAVPPDVLLRAVIAWTQLFGMISFELFGQFVGSFEPADALFAHSVAQLAALRRDSRSRRSSRRRGVRHSVAPLLSKREQTGADVHGPA